MHVRQPFLMRSGDADHERIAIDRFPFRIGRAKDAELRIASREVSSFHAEIVRLDDGYGARDLDSRNGTFVNGERVVGTAPIDDGDLLHVAQIELRFGLSQADAFADEHTLASPAAAQQQLVREASDLARLFAQRAVRAAFQPIVRLADRVTVGYETLGRPGPELTDYSIGALLRIAAERGQGARLSRLLRDAALASLPRVPEPAAIVFFNLHPSEMHEAELLRAQLDAITAALAPAQRGVLEIHESAVTDLGLMRSVRGELHARGLGLAYDDFGAGQSRLMELVEVPPEYLKLDMSLVRDIDLHPRRQELVRALIAVMIDLGIAVLAEGVERAAEGDTCRALGCTLGQGYLYGRPAALP